MAVTRSGILHGMASLIRIVMHLSWLCAGACACFLWWLGRALPSLHIGSSKRDGLSTCAVYVVSTCIARYRVRIVWMLTAHWCRSAWINLYFNFDYIPPLVVECCSVHPFIRLFVMVRSQSNPTRDVDALP
ncbi:hypothetical protein BJ165DRAFT_427844 [Panaeolus papilionaceus]|nr:hypothetical protein BJ165DRAFT_427844 [Panaeolus papilionaceus]